MKEMLLVDEYLGDRVSCPDHIADNLEDYLCEFDDWLKADGRFKAADPEGTIGNSFGRDDVVDWFNEVVLSGSEEKIAYLQRDFWPSSEEFKRLPVFYV